MSILNCSQTLLANGNTLFYGRQLMGVPAVGEMQRFCVFKTPLLELTTSTKPETMCTPTVQVTVDSNSQGLGNVMFIYSVQITPNGADTLFTIDARDLSGFATFDDYFCNITVFGRIVKGERSE